MEYETQPCLCFIPHVKIHRLTEWERGLQNKNVTSVFVYKVLNQVLLLVKIIKHKLK